MERKEHWDRVYAAKQVTQVSWYAPHLERSIAMIRSVTVPSAEIIDVGGGASTLVDDLVALGYTSVTILDVSDAALTAAKRRLGDQAASVKWIASDLTTAHLPVEAFDVWHDRAVFHFLTKRTDRRSYVDLLTRSIKLGGFAVVATFSLEGPQRCSGLDVVRYSAADLSRELGPGFVLKREMHEKHRTPTGAEQSFMYCLFERIERAS